MIGNNHWFKKKFVFESTFLTSSTCRPRRSRLKRQKELTRWTELTTSYQGSKDEPLVLRPLDQGPWFKRTSFLIPFIHKMTQNYSIEKLFYSLVLSVASKKKYSWNCTTISNMKTDLILHFRTFRLNSHWNLFGWSSCLTFKIAAFWRVCLTQLIALNTGIGLDTTIYSVCWWRFQIF